MTRDRPPQNIYDDPEFFAGYSTLNRFGSGWKTAVEHDDFKRLLPDLEGKRVADLGCGAGQWALYVAEAGAAEVLAVDLSERMLALARRERAHPRIRYQRAALETLDLAVGRFDLVLSSLAFHYVADYVGLIRRVSDSLVSGGVLLFSTEHPIYTAGEPKKGWATDVDGTHLHWALDQYSDEGLREKRWYVESVHKYHRTMATLLNGLLDAGLTIERVLEPVPSVDIVAKYPNLIDERRRPTFLLVRARKP